MAAGGMASCAFAEDGYRLWMRYEPLPEATVAQYKPHATAVVVPGSSKTTQAIRHELVTALTGMLGIPVHVASAVERHGAIVVGTPQSSPLIAALDLPLKELGPEGYCIRSVMLDGHQVTVVAANSEVGALYGAFHLLRLMQSSIPLERVALREKPRIRLRMLNHWDNLDGVVTWGFGGKSLWKWDELPGKVDERLRDYARANASIGINGTVLNNVNSDARSLTREYLVKTAAIADVFRPYGLRVYLAARFSAPMEIGGLKTADPLDPGVATWWREKADEICGLIPDFGGFLVKANSEGQPGPRTYNRTHADGANMLAAALAPHNGVVIWRAFVYDYKPGYDRAAAAFDELAPFDGKFALNVLLQVKNGPIDFMPREPFHPLFGAMPRTPLVPEFQITQEYMGRNIYLAFLAPMWREFFDSDSYAKGEGSTVAKVADGSLDGQRITGIAGVANTGDDRNWTGHHFGQANWYAFGRLAWDHTLTSEQIAREWIKMTFSNDPAVVAAITRIMLESREAIVDYTMPLGLHHITRDHYRPGPWLSVLQHPETIREDWGSVYYHRADEKGLGFDRTKRGSNAVNCYQPEVRDRFADLATCPEKLLLWFHHVPWDHRLRSGRTLWEELAMHYHRGVEWVLAVRGKWASLSGAIDAERHVDVARKLEIQLATAYHWRDACLLYFLQFSKQPFPKECKME
jgi:alpha-glucuronidase